MPKVTKCAKGIKGITVIFGSRWVVEVPLPLPLPLSPRNVTYSSKEAIDHVWKTEMKVWGNVEKNHDKKVRHVNLHPVVMVLASFGQM